jgi:sialic acid synthase SpsE
MNNRRRSTIVAEIGTSHRGSLESAKTLIHAARDAGADAVKFQWVYADEILHPKSGLVPLPGGDVPLYQRFQDLEMPPDFYAACLAEAHESGLQFFCSPFGLRSLAELVAIHPDAIKIASPELNHYPLLNALPPDIPVILSTGVSTLADSEKALACLPAAPVLLHCVTAYPAPPADYNLRLIPHLAALFAVPVGVSDHSLDPTLIPTLAVAMGAVMLEKHITLSRTTSGLDDPVALEPHHFAAMVTAVRQTEAALGDGAKRLAPSEKENYPRTNRSLHYMRDIKVGTVLEAGDIGVLRTEKVLSVGLSPEFLDKILGSRLTRDVCDGAGVVWSDVTVKT